MNDKLTRTFLELPAGKFHRLFNHGPTVIVSTGTPERANAAPVQWNMPLNDDPPLAAIALDADNFTAELLGKTGEFVLNIPEASQLPEIKAWGRVSGRKEDKLKAAHLGAGVRVKTPHLMDCLGFVECRQMDLREYDGVQLVVGEVLYAAADPARFANGRLAQDVETVHHLGGLAFALTGRRIE